MLLDTCFLIDLQREFKANTNGPASQFLHKHLATRFAISEIAAIEFMEGFNDPSEGEIFLSGYRRIPIGPATAREAARIRRSLRLSGQRIGDFDILIAATAQAESLPLVTNNTIHFDRIPDLECVLY